MLRNPRYVTVCVRLRPMFAMPRAAMPSSAHVEERMSRSGLHSSGVLKRAMETARYGELKGRRNGQALRGCAEHHAIGVMNS